MELIMPEDFTIIDCHLHSGVQNVNWSWPQVRPLLLAAGITGAAPIPPVEDIYDRHDPEFADTPAWQACRRRAHQYLLELQDPEIAIYPYFFVWNDFAREDLGPEYVAIKWHRHPGEPVYRYGDPRCREFLAVVRERRLPILLEESLENTLFFLTELAPDLPVIIPHLGGLSGGYIALDRAGVWRRPQVYADTAVAALPEIKDFVRRFGADRLMFGSDHPFSSPATELNKILSLNLPEAQTRAILGDNFRRLCRLG
jgi:uncharacterized protein